MCKKYLSRTIDDTVMGLVDEHLVCILIVPKMLYRLFYYSLVSITDFKRLNFDWKTKIALVLSCECTELNIFIRYVLLLNN